MIRIYEPEYWRLLKIKSNEETYYKVFGCWLGGFASGDSWKLSSGFEPQCITLLDNNTASITQYSGSVYEINRAANGSPSMYLRSVFDNMLQQRVEGYELVEVYLDFDTGLITEYK